jgi:hypothetical protein
MMMITRTFSESEKKKERERLAEHVSYMGKTRNAYIIFVGKSYGKGRLGISRKDNK